MFFVRASLQRSKESGVAGYLRRWSRSAGPDRPRRSGGQGDTTFSTFPNTPEVRVYCFENSSLEMIANAAWQTAVRRFRQDCRLTLTITQPEVWKLS